MARLIHKNKTVLIPIDGGLGYDLAIEENGRLTRVQCKSGHLKHGCLVFKTASQYYHKPGLVKTKNYIGRADVFGIFCHENGRVYLIPVKDAPHAGCSLRLEPSRNGQSKNIRWAKDYELA